MNGPVTGANPPRSVTTAAATDTVPQCQGRAPQQWAELQRDHLLPVPYCHLEFPLPHQLNGWVQLHLEVIYRLCQHQFSLSAFTGLDCPVFNDFCISQW